MAERGRPRCFGQCAPIELKVLLKVSTAGSDRNETTVQSRFQGRVCQKVISTSKPIANVGEAYGIDGEALRNWLEVSRSLRRY